MTLALETIETIEHSEFLTLVYQSQSPNSADILSSSIPRGKPGNCSKQRLEFGHHEIMWSTSN